MFSDKGGNHLYKQIGQIKYKIDIQGDGPPVLLLHGFTGTLHTWDQLVEEYKRDFQFIRIDLPGHGHTEANDEFTMELVCRDLNEILDELSLSAVHLLGYSMGGRTSLSFTMTYPSRVKSLILESSSPGLDSTHEQLARQVKDEGLAKELEEHGLEHFINKWEDLPMFDSQKQLPEQVQQSIRKERMNQTALGLAASLRGMGTGVQPSWWDKLSVFPRQVLLITGEKDDKFYNISREMNKQFRNSTHKHISDCGHAIHVEQPRIFGTIVRDFLLEVEEDENA